MWHVPSFSTSFASKILGDRIFIIAFIINRISTPILPGKSSHKVLFGPNQIIHTFARSDVCYAHNIHHAISLILVLVNAFYWTPLWSKGLTFIRFGKWRRFY